MNSRPRAPSNKSMDDQQRGVRLTVASGSSVTVLVDGEFCATGVSVCVGGVTLSASNASIEAVEGRHGTLFTADVAELLARYADLVKRACGGVLSVGGVAIADALDAHEKETLAAAGDDADAARVEMMVARAMIPDFVEG